MKKVVYLCLIVFALFNMFCKKKTTTTSSGASSGNNNGIGIGYYGILTMSNSQWVNSGTLSASTPSASAYFSTSPTGSQNYSTFTKVSSVSLNAVIYKFLTWMGDYEDSTGTAPTLPTTWVVNGLGSIPSFSYTNNGTMPSFTNYTTLPDTVYKNQTNTFNTSGTTGADLIEINISDFSGHISSQTLIGSSTSLSFDASTLSSFSAGNSATLLVNCTKNNSQTFSGKAFNFQMNYQLRKSVYVK